MISTLTTESPPSSQAFSVVVVVPPAAAAAAVAAAAAASANSSNNNNNNHHNNNNNKTVTDCAARIISPPKMPAVNRKVAIMGYRSVGKSSLTIRFVENQFVDSYDPTIENTFTKTFRTDGKEVSLKIIDTAGQDEYSIFPTGYTMDINGYVLVYSVTSRQSFEVVKKIYQKLLDQTGVKQLPVVLVGNKNDLRNERVVSPEEGRELARYMKGVFLEASAKQNDCVLDIFTQLIGRINVVNVQSDSSDKGSSCVVS
ncbi:GTP-binding protein Rheb homolog [Galendromus occidentalis]|uniref:GTP-binding protein Rheb homolog n=1 Tax=Galendromus occidentalis TaxID=34638 RepID=A0AAJ6QW27_9ACAR|nr:GTP-binding protein Rheb homolog [Galendromus occidentalis]